MALDGVFLSVLRRDILDTALNARVDKIYQPSKEEIMILFLIFHIKVFIFSSFHYFGFTKK